MGLVHGPDDVYLAMPILERGMTVFPENWELPFWAGYLHYIYLEDYDTAGEYFWRAAHCPNAPVTFLSLMLSSLKKSGRYEMAIYALERLIESSDNENIIRIYEKRKVRFENMIMLQKAAGHFQTVTGRPLTDLEQLVSAKILPVIPEDPMGKRYWWDNKNNRVILAEEEKKPLE